MNSGDTVFVLLSASFVMLMTPGLALFYGGMVRNKNVLGTIMQSFIILGIISVEWILWGYSMSFGADHGGIIGGLDWFGWGASGWINKMGAMDFAGGTVVHINSGLSALAAAIIVGKRRGFGNTSYIPHNVPMTITGAALLWFGWFGFNAGSALSIRFCRAYILFNHRRFFRRNLLWRYNVKIQTRI